MTAKIMGGSVLNHKGKQYLEAKNVALVFQKQRNQIIEEVKDLIFELDTVVATSDYKWENFKSVFRTRVEKKLKSEGKWKIQ